MTPANPITLTQAELYTLLVSSVRYAMGRRTYIVSDTAEIVLRHMGALTRNEREVLARDINEALVRANAAGVLLGQEMDHRVWTRLRNRLLEIDGDFDADCWP